MKNFDLNRTGNLCKWLVYNYGGKLSRIQFGITVGILVLLMLHSFSAGGSADEYTSDAVGAFFVYGLMVLAISPVLRSPQSKEDRITYLMLPASQLEKFLMNYVGITIVAFLGFIVAFVLADILNWLLSFILPYGFHTFAMSGFADLASGVSVNPTVTISGSPELTSTITPMQKFLMAMFAWGILFTFHSIAMVGGVIFSKNRVLYTLILMATIIIMVPVVIALFIDSSQLFSEQWIESLASFKNKTLILGLIVALQWSIIIFLYWFAYHRYKKMQITFGKVFNW